jgi:diguanylate cyclase (GGDEF)-like protein/PAS domain S-box-containing protein
MLEAKPVERAAMTDEVAGGPTTLSDALVRLAETEDILRAIGAGEVDAFVISDGGSEQRVFTLSTADRPYRMFVENMRDGAATVSSSGLILYANRRLAELLSCSRETIVGSPLARFMAADVPIGLDEIRGPGGVGTTVEFDLLDGDGAVVPVLVGSSPLEVDSDQLICLTFTDLTARKAQDREIARLGRDQAERMAELQDAQAALTEQATHDALTGLPNRNLLVDRIAQALSHSQRSRRFVAVLFVDLDDFKQVNDTHGHAAGDAVLRRVAEQMRAALRPMDTVARIGGDEFAVLAPDVDSQVHAVSIANRLVTAFRGPHDRKDTEPVTASVGISMAVGGRATAETLLTEADTAMYHAKGLGGARVEVFDSALGRKVRQRSAEQRALQSALDAGRVIVHYQPIIDLRSGGVTGFEALARLAELDGSIVLPAAFIPSAEDSGLIVPLGERVLEMACHEACSWHLPGPPESRLTIAVNISSHQLDRYDLTTFVGETLAQTGLDPQRLHLELTETAIIDLRPHIVQQLARIRDLGAEIGLDDFGTGYASLTHLRRLPLTFVKIDRSFVRGLETDQEDDRIVSAVVNLAASLGLRSIAEGVETGGQLDRLRELGCDQAQGYLFARPLPPDALPTVIQRSAW